MKRSKSKKKTKQVDKPRQSNVVAEVMNVLRENGWEFESSSDEDRGRKKRTTEAESSNASSSDHESDTSDSDSNKDICMHLKKKKSRKTEDKEKVTTRKRKTDSQYLNKASDPSGVKRPRSRKAEQVEVTAGSSKQSITPQFVAAVTKQVLKELNKKAKDEEFSKKKRSHSHHTIPKRKRTISPSSDSTSSDNESLNGSSDSGDDDADVVAVRKTMPVKSAMDAVLKGLHDVKVSKHDATELQRKLEGELFDKWDEKCETATFERIDFDEIDQFIDRMQCSYEGIDDQVKRKMMVIKNCRLWQNKIIEWKFNKGDNSGARYGMIALGKSPDRKFVDCMYVMYMMNFKIAPRELVNKKRHSVLGGLYSWTTRKVVKEERSLGSESIKRLQNFFRLKALEAFQREGLIQSVNYVHSLEDVQGSIENPSEKGE